MVDAQLVVVDEAREDEDVGVLDQPERHHDRRPIPALENDLLDLAEVEVGLEAAAQQDDSDNAGHGGPDQRSEDRALDSGAGGEERGEHDQAEDGAAGVGDQEGSGAPLEPERDVADLEEERGPREQTGERDEVLVLGIAEQAVGDRPTEDVDQDRGDDRPSTTVHARPAPRVCGGEDEAASSSSSSSSSSSPPPKTRRTVPGLTSSEAIWVTRPARKVSSPKRAISLGPRNAATTSIETSCMAFATTSEIACTDELRMTRTPRTAPEPPG